MITEVKEKHETDLWAVNFEFDKQWVVVRRDPSDDKFYLVAYGDGTPEDRDALRQKIVLDRYKGKAFLRYAYTPREDVVSGQFDF